MKPQRFSALKNFTVPVANSVTSFGEGVNGELYLTDSGGNLFHLNAYRR